MSVVVQNPWTTKVSSGLSFSAILRSKESAVKEPETSNHNKTSPPQAGASVSNTDTESSNVARDGDAAPHGKKHNNNGGKSTKPGPDSKSVAHEKSENNKAATQNPSTQATLTKPTDAVAKSKHRTATPSTQVTSDLFVEKSDAGVPPSPRASCTYHKQSELIAFDFEPLKIAGPSAGTYTFGNISASSDVTATSAPHMKSQEGGAKPVQKRAGQNFTTPDARNTLNNTAHEVAHNVYGNVAVSNVGQTLPQLDGAAAPGEVPTETGMVSHYTPYDVPMYNTNEYHAHAPVPVPIPGSHVGTGMDYNTSLGNPQQHIPAPGVGLGHNMQHVTTQPPSSNASSNSTTPSAHTTTNLAYHPNNGLPPSGSTGAPLRTRGPGTNPSQSTRAPHASSYAPRYVPPHGAFPMPPHANQWPGYGYPPMGAMPGQGGHPVPTSATIPSGPSSGQTSRTGPGHTMPMGGRGIFTRGAPMPPYYPPYDYGMSSYSGHPNHHHLASNTPAGPPLQSGAYGIPPGYPGPYYGHPSGPQGSGSGNRYGAPMNNRYASGNQGMMDPNSGQY